MSTRRLTVLLLVLVGGLFVTSLLVGRVATLTALLFAGPGADDPMLWLIFTEIRLPRALLALLIGASLGLSGAVLQGFLRNPLAEPGVVGVSATAALGAVLALYFGLADVYAFALPVGGLLGALVGMLAVVLLAGSSALTLILAGVAVTSLAGALTSLALSLAPSPYAALEIVFWLLGSLADRSFDHVWLALPVLLPGWLLLASCARGLDALALGEEVAHSLGVHLGWLRLRVVLGVGLTVGAGVAVAGSIGFVGLVVPHLLRPLVAQRPGLLLGVSALGGAALLLAADIATRVLTPGPELKLGVVTALIGAPFFLYLLLQLRRTLP